MSFDIALIDRFDCQVYCLDPTPRAAAHVSQLCDHLRAGRPYPINSNPAEVYRLGDPSRLDRFHFLRLGLNGSDGSFRFYAPANEEHVSHSIVNLQRTDRSFEADCRTVKSLMDELGHRQLDLLKLDIEGAEHAVLERMLLEGVRPRIVCVEFDWALQQGRHYGALRLMQRIVRAGYELAVDSDWNSTFLYRGLSRPIRRLRNYWRLGRRARLAS